MGLKDKASKIDFGAMARVPSASPGAEPKAKTAPGELMAFANQQRSELLQENETLKARAAEADALRRSLDEAVEDLRHWDGAKAARLLDPKTIRRSRWANRHELNFLSQDFEDLCAEIRNAGGNIQPIKVRTISDATDGIEYEIVFGHRRHEACRREGLPVLALIDNIDERAMFVEMDRENRARKNLSAFEQGLMYRQALSGGLFPSQKSLALATGVDQSLLTKALYLADLHKDIVAAFPSILDIQFRFAKPLNDALEKAPDAVLKEARKIAKESPRPDVKTVFERLTGVAQQKMERFHFPEPVQFQRGSKAVGTLSIGPKGVSLTVSSGTLTDDQVGRLRALVEQMLAEE